MAGESNQFRPSRRLGSFAYFLGLAATVLTVVAFFRGCFGPSKSEISIAIYEIKLRKNEGLYEDPLFRFLIRNKGDSDGSLLSNGEIEMVVPEQKRYLLLQDQRHGQDSPLPIPIPARSQQLFIDYTEEDHHIAAQLRMGHSVRVKLRIPYVDSDGRTHSVEFDTTLSPR